MLQSEDGEYLDMTGFEIAMRARIYPDGECNLQLIMLSAETFLLR